MTESIFGWRFPGFAAALGAAPARPITRPAAPPGIESIRSREPEAWNQLFAAEMPAIYRYALSRLGRHGAAEDATSDVFEQAWRNATTLEDRGVPVRAWLFGIARHVVGEHRRSFFKRPPQLALEAFDSAAADPNLDPEQIDLARAVAGLPAAHAEVINLRFIQGLSLQETAEVLGTSVDGVKGRQARALAALRDRLQG